MYCTYVQNIKKMHTHASDEFRHAVAAGLHRYILVLGEVDASVASAEQLQLLPLVAR